MTQVKLATSIKPFMKAGKPKPKNALKTTIKRETTIIKNPNIRIRNLFINTTQI